MAEDLAFGLTDPGPATAEDEGLGNDVVHPTGHMQSPKKGTIIPYMPSEQFREATGFEPKQWDTYRGHVANIESQSYEEAPIQTGSVATPTVSGRYQMGPAEISKAAGQLGIPTPDTDTYLHNPHLQEQLFEQYTLDHHQQLMKNPQYAGADPESRMAMLAGAHYAGVGGLNKWLATGGEANPTDRFGRVSLSNYVEGTLDAVGGEAGSVTPVDWRPQPIPQINPGHASGPSTIGPYPNYGTAMAAAPSDKENYQLLNQGDGYAWVPLAKGDTNPAVSPYYDPGISSKLAAPANAVGPQTFGGQIDHLVANVGPTFRAGLAGSLDLPVELVGKGLNAIAGATGVDALRNHWGTPVGDWMKREDWNMTPLYEDGWGATIGSGIGYGVGSALPFLAAGAIAEPFAGASALARGVARWMGNPGRSVGAAANEAFIAAGAGVGGQEAHELYKGATGRERDIGDVMTQLVGGGLWNVARVGALSALEKTAGGAWAMRYNSNAPKGTVLNAQTGAEQAGIVLADNLNTKLTQAQQDVAAFARVNPQDSASYLATQSKQAAGAVDAFARGSRADERALWSLVNTGVQVDYSKVNGLWQQMRQDHFADTLRDPADWPKEFDGIIGKPIKSTGLGGAQGFNPATGAQTYGGQAQAGLANIDTLGRGQDLRSRLNYAIEKELTTGGQRPVNAPYVGYLQKTRNALTDAMNNASGATPQEIQQLQMAQLFSRARNNIMESPEMRAFLNSGDATALTNLIRRGPEGSDAVQILTNAANQKYGSDGLLSAAKDSLRQMYTDAVAPNGYVSTTEHQRFMKNWEPYLSDPHFQDVRTQLEAAAGSERQVNQMIQVGRPVGFGNSATQADARIAAAQNYLGAPVDLVMNHLEKASSQQLAAKRVIQQLQEGWPGQIPQGGTPAQQGFMHALAGRVLSDPGYAAKNEAILRQFDTVNPGFTDRALQISTPQSMAGVAKWTRDLVGAYVGAQLGQKVASGGMGSSMVMAGRGSEAARAVLSGALDKAFKVSTAAIVDPQANAALGRLMGKAPSTLAQKAADVLLFHSYVPGFLADNIHNPDTTPGSGAPGSQPAQDEQGNVQGSPAWWENLARQHQQMRGNPGQQNGPQNTPIVRPGNRPGQQSL